MPAAPSAAADSANGQGEQGTGIPWYFRPYKFDRSSTTRGDLEKWPTPYLPPDEGSSSTAQVSETTTATTTVTGQVTNTGTGTTVSSAFSTTNIFNDSATLSAQSPAGFSPNLQSAAGELQTGWAQLKEVDISSGTNAGGLVNASFENIGSETTTYSFFSTTNTTPTSANPVIYQEMQSRSMSTSTTETGTYTTTAPGAPSVTPTLDNPAGYAKFNEERIDNNSVSNTASVSWVATEAGDGSNETATMSYTGSATSSYTSDKTIAVDAGANTDAQSGSYTATGMKSDWSTMGRKGGSVGPVYGVTWNYGSTLASSRSITDVGLYPGGGMETLVSSGGRVWAETDVFSLNSPSINYNWTTGYQSHTGAPTVSVTQSDSLAQSMADPGPDAPQEAKGRAAARRHASVGERPDGHLGRAEGRLRLLHQGLRGGAGEFRSAHVQGLP